jgi:hypothetical protein
MDFKIGNLSNLGFYTHKIVLRYFRPKIRVLISDVTGKLFFVGLDSELVIPENNEEGVV